MEIEERLHGLTLGVMMLSLFGAYFLTFKIVRLGTLMLIMVPIFVIVWYFLTLLFVIIVIKIIDLMKYIFLRK